MKYAIKVQREILNQLDKAEKKKSNFDKIYCTEDKNFTYFINAYTITRIKKSECFLDISKFESGTRAERLADTYFDTKTLKNLIPINTTDIVITRDDDKKAKIRIVKVGDNYIGINEKFYKDAYQQDCSLYIMKENSEKKCPPIYFSTSSDSKDTKSLYKIVMPIALTQQDIDKIKTIIAE